MYCSNKINIQLWLLRVLQLSVNLDRSLQPKFISIREKQTSDAKDTPANQIRGTQQGSEGAQQGLQKSPGTQQGRPTYLLN
jgi:hypothetical protein